VGVCCAFPKNAVEVILSCAWDAFPVVLDSQPQPIGRKHSTARIARARGLILLSRLRLTSLPCTPNRTSIPSGLSASAVTLEGGFLLGGKSGESVEIVLNTAGGFISGFVPCCIIVKRRSFPIGILSLLANG